MTRIARTRPIRGTDTDHRRDIQAPGSLPGWVTERRPPSGPWAAAVPCQSPLLGPDQRYAVETFFTIAEVAARLRVSTRTLRRLVRSGALSCVRVGRRVRISVAALDAFCGSQVSGRYSFNDSS